MIAGSLGGGGVNGYFEIGACYFLHEKGILQKIKCYSGTSIGGINAMLLSKYNNNIDEVLAIWELIKKNTDIYSGKIDFFGILKALPPINAKSILNQQGLYKILNNEFSNMKFGDLKIPVSITGTNLTLMRTEIFNSIKQPYLDALVISKITSAINVLFQFQLLDINVDGELIKCMLTDGGVMANDPILTAINMGADKIIAFGTSPLNTIKQDLKLNAMGNAEGTLKTLLRGYTANMVKNIKENHSNIKILYLYPEHDLGSALEVKDMQAKFDAGYNTAKKYWSNEKIQDFLK